MEFPEFSKAFKPKLDASLVDFLNFNFSDSRQELEQALNYSVNVGGKRVRPLLCIASHQLFSDDIDPILPFACAMEMVHTYSLIHDDLPAMDNDDFRRGNPTCHKRFGEDIAILAGDTLNTFAFELVSRELPRYFADSAVLRAIELMAHSFGISGMSGGQVMDLRGHKTTNDVDYLIKTHQLKTGAMLEKCLVVPGVLAQASDSVIHSLSKIGGHLGLLFQIIDDILDVTESSDVLGKSPKKDEAQDKLTYVSVMGLSGAREKARSEAKSAKQELQHLSAPNTDTIASLIDYLEERNH